MVTDIEQATLAGGCFWCVEAALEELDGVRDVTSGYAGGHTENPSYREVCSGNTGHAEVVQVEYDPEVIDYADLLDAFFTVHDPTTLNREGPDVGTQYRSAIFTHSDDQHEQAEQYVEALESEGGYEESVVTEIEPLETFYEAEEEHQNYYAKNPGDAYCSFHAQPKIEKVREKFSENLTV